MITSYQLKQLKHLTRRYKVKYRFVDKNSCDSSYCDLYTDTIYIRNYRRSNAKFLSIVLHEICHILCKREGKFKAYHTPRYVFTPNQLLQIIRTGWRAEKYVDKRAEEILKLNYPKLKFYPGYDDIDKEWLDRNYLDNFREAYYEKTR